MEHVVVVMGLLHGLMSTACIGKYSILFTKSKSRDQVAAENRSALCYMQRRNFRNLDSISRPSMWTPDITVRPRSSKEPFPLARIAALRCAVILITTGVRTNKVIACWDIVKGKGL